MSITRETGRTGFFKELTPERRKEYLGLKREKFLPTVDNLYFSVFITNDAKNIGIDTHLNRLIEYLEEKKAEANQAHDAIDFGYGLAMTLKSYSFYGFCLTEQDLYDIFICKSIPNKNTPRIVIQLRAFGLWTRGVDEILIDAYRRVERMLLDYGCTIEKTRESRIDYCFHTNAITNVDALLVETKGRVKNLHTNLKHVTLVADLEHLTDGTKFHKDYLCFGRKESNNVRARIYDKVKEVIEMGYKDFFFKIWYDNGLISYYDKWCMEYAFPFRNVDYLYKAAVAFYVEHGFCKSVGSEKCILEEIFKCSLLCVPTDYYKRCKVAIDNERTTLADFKKLAKEHMPKVTSILNIEYETKRKFYYYSDKFIQNFRTVERTIPAPLERIYKILDNKGIFLDYLTSKTLAFHAGKDASGNLKYLAWWLRLRNTKLGGIKANEKLLREYSFEMDKRVVMQRTVSAIASNAVYDDNLETGFVEDFSDFVSYISDNESHRMGRMVIYNTDEADMLQSEDLPTAFNLRYAQAKSKKERQLKNRKKKKDVIHDNITSR